jgi:hypothetical protein
MFAKGILNLGKDPVPGPKSQDKHLRVRIRMRIFRIRNSIIGCRIYIGTVPVPANLFNFTSEHSLEYKINKSHLQ